MNQSQIKTLLACMLACGALLLSACAPAVHIAARTVSVTEIVEDDPVLAEELELTLLEAPAALEEDPVTPTPFPEAAFLAGDMLPLETALQSASIEELSIPATFAITRPDKAITTAYGKYFITGTSDPSSPVYFGTDAIERLGNSGVFGVQVDLEMGANTFTFRQGDRTETVTIVRAAATTAATAINEITQSSMVPAVMTGVKAGEKLSVGCIAPAGATVTASYEGATITLKQTRDDVRTGLPATFTGKIAIDKDGYAPDTTEQGKSVNYTLDYNGATSTYASSGHVYVAGVNSDVAVQITGYVGFIYPDTSNLSNFKEVVKAGARDYVVEETNEYFELASGGFINKTQVKIITGKVRVQNKLSDVTFARTGSGETITFSGSRNPIYNSWIEDNVFYLRLYNTAGSPKVGVGDSRLASSVSITENEDEARVTYKFPLSGTIWGYDIAFNGKDTVLTWKYKPTIGSASAPLSGMTILLDPGHGGEDPGALGLAGKTGPTEADVNLANALATRDELEARGAVVILTRTGDEYVSLDNRLQMIEDKDVDMFLSLHHNSIAESEDANKVSGVEVYYHTALSRKSSDNLMARISSDLGRANRTVTQSYYRVTLLPYAPSMLLELGFMSHPLDYENAVDSTEMKNVASAIADGVVASLH